jgi:hypothetical protein
VVFNSADLNAESTFWARLLDGTVDAETEFRNWDKHYKNRLLKVDGEPKRWDAAERLPGILDRL